MSKRMRILLAGATALVLVGASAGDMALAQHRGGGHGGGGGASVSGGASIGARGGGMTAAPSFSGRATTGAAPSFRGNTFSGNRFSGNRFSGSRFSGNRFSTFNRGPTFRGNFGFRDRRFHRFGRFRGGVFFGFPGYYAYDYPYDCSFARPWDWRWRRWCGPYAYNWW